MLSKDGADISERCAVVGGERRVECGAQPEDKARKDLSIGNTSSQ